MVFLNFDFKKVKFDWKRMENYIFLLFIEYYGNEDWLDEY